MNAVELGALGARGRVRVDPRGGLVVPDGVAVEWMVRGAARWFVAAEEAAVRQGIDGSEVVATRMRVDGGDIAHRVWAVPLPGGAGGAVVEVVNETPQPVAVALGTRAVAPIGSIRADGVSVDADGRPVLLAERSMRAAFVGSADRGDSMERARIDEDPASSGTCPAGMANATGVWPLPHGSAIRFLLPFEPVGPGSVDVGRLPPAESVARGWELHLEGAARVDSGEPRLEGLARSALRRLLLAAEDPTAGHTGPALTVLALASWGLSDAAASVLDAMLDDRDMAGPAEAGPALAAAGALWALQRDTRRVDDALALAASVGPRIERAARRRRVGGRGLIPGSDAPPWMGDERASAAWATAWCVAGLRGAGLLAGAAGQREGADELRTAADAVADGLTDAAPADPAREVDHLVHPSQAPLSGIAADRGLGAALLMAAANGPDPATTAALVEAAPVGRWPDPAAGGGDSTITAALAVLYLRRRLVTEQRGTLAVLAATPVPVGTGVEVYELPTRSGWLSFAVRWHGERPALLWELRGHGDVGSISITAPGLDPGFDSSEPRGETLLAAASSR